MEDNIEASLEGMEDLHKRGSRMIQLSLDLT